MSKTLRFASTLLILGTAAGAWAAGCSSSGSGTPPNPDAGHTPDGSVSTPDGGDAGTTTTPDGSSDGSSGVTYVLIDDMESTTHGPIELDAGFVAGESPAYWFNFGASKLPEAGPPPDTATPPIMSFTFSAVTPPTTTLNGKTSAHAAHQACTLNTLYDVCGIGMEFAQVIAPDAGPLDAAIVDAGPDADAGPPIPKITVPFDISRYQGITFWGKTSLPTDATGFDIKVLFPDTDTDPRGGVCNSFDAGASDSTDTSQCYNSYAFHVSFTGDWQQFTVMFSDLAIDTTFGFQRPQPWSGTNVYGINWQAQDNDTDDASAQPMDLWIDDVYFIE
jgi:hypothetical protein